MATIQYLSIDPSDTKPPTRDHALAQHDLPGAAHSNLHPFRSGGENARLFFVGTATTILEWQGIRLMTDPNFLHAGEHVHLGPGVTAKRETNPAVKLEDLPPIDIVLLSHYHEDHFDRKVEASLRRDLPIVTTPHAKQHLDELKASDERFTAVTALDTYETAIVEINASGGEQKKKNDLPPNVRPALHITAMPGKHVPSGIIDKVNDLLGVVPPTNGWMLELGYLPAKTDHLSHQQQKSPPVAFECAYRIYISGDTLLVDELRDIPRRYANQPIDLMLVHLGGTTIPSLSLPLFMVTMDADQGIQLIQLIKPDLTIPIHFDDYDMFRSPLDHLKRKAQEAGLSDQIVYLDRGDDFCFRVRAPL